MIQRSVGNDAASRAVSAGARAWLAACEGGQESMPGHNLSLYGNTYRKRGEKRSHFARYHVTAVFLEGSLADAFMCQKSKQLL